MSEYQDPAFNAVAVTPSDLAADNFDVPARGLYVGGAGDVQVVMEGGATILFVAVPVGTILPIRFIRVTDANTDATNMVALY
jgi:hypothetical protein